VATQWKEHVRTGHLQRHEAWYALIATVMKTIEFPLIALTLTERQCIHIMDPILMSGLPACGICCYFPRDVIYAPTKFQGVGLKNIYITMGLKQIALVSSAGQSASITGRLICTSIEATKLELGLRSSVFQSSFQKFGKLATTCWISHTWNFMQDMDIKMIKGTPSLKLRWVSNKFLVEYFHHSGFTGKSLICLNRCRLFLQVTSLADITTADGSLITHETWHGIYDDTRPHYYTWPNQGDPSTSDWVLWRRAL
jgi:hypothetical protein